MKRFVIYYGGKDIDEFEAEDENEAIKMARESDAFSAEEEND